MSIINESIMSENRVRRDKYQRPIRILSKSEYVTFKALLIAASVHNEQGAQLWLEVQATKKKKGLKAHNNFGKYMKQWRFKEIKQRVPHITRDKSVKETDD